MRRRLHPRGTGAGRARLDHRAAGAEDALARVAGQVRPVHHWLAPRVRAHVFLCMLAYCVEFHLRGDRTFNLTARPTALQQKAFDLLRVPPPRVQ